MIKWSKKKERKEIYNWNDLGLQGNTIYIYIYQEGTSCSDEGMIGVNSEVTRGGEDDEDDEEFACDVVLVVGKLVDLTAAD